MNYETGALVHTSYFILRPGAAPPPPGGNGRAFPANAVQEVLTIQSNVEREHLLRLLEQTAWRIRGKKGAATILGLKPTTLEFRMAKLGLRRPA